MMAERYLITGASRGIGRAIAEKLAAPDRELLLHGRDQEALVEVYTNVEAAGAKPSIHLCDLTRPKEIEKMVQKIGNDPLHALINNAGIAVVKPLGDITLEEWQATVDINITATFLLTQKLAPLMPEGATIVNVLSVAAKTGFPEWSSYSMSKFAIEGFSQSVREELRPLGIRVVNVYPAATATEIWNEIEGDWPLEQMLPADEVAEAVAYALSRPNSVLVENISVGRQRGNF
jgi:short-subunit dehydrogenase